MRNFYENAKKRTFEILEKSQKGDILSTIFDYFIVILISLNVVSVFIETFDLSVYLNNFLRKFEIFSIIIFTIEYILRLWTSTLLYPDKNSFVARIKYIFSLMAIIDLVSILPFYLPFFFNVDLRVLRALRLFRLLRILKVNRYTHAMQKVLFVIKNKSTELISSIFVIFILMLISSVLMYSVESPVQPEVFKNGFSGLWWAVATFTTVGYGDIYPITSVGRLLSAIIALLGIGLVAVPTGIVTSGFMEANSKEDDENSQQDEKHFCPYCGKNLD